MQNFVSHFKKVKNLGASGGAATHHFLMQRLSAIFLLPVVFWALISLLCLFHKILHGQINAPLWDFLQSQSLFYYIPLILMIIVGIYHGMLGIQVIIEDYIQCKIMKHFFIISCKLFSFFTILIFLFTFIL